MTEQTIYTRSGDQGETALGDGSRVRKDNPRIRAYGAVDEVNAAVGMARLHASGEMAERLATIQNDLIGLGADLHKHIGDDDTPLRIGTDMVTHLETEIDTMNAGLPPLTSFVLPGGTALAAHLHVCRTLVRRAERLTAKLAAEESVNPAVQAYLNRLSDWFFVAARVANDNGQADRLWQAGA
ncbi:cob(I)yrinic acid a,c-diamide adenosyltransferase [Rhodovulum adriaticum]|uniref:Corrinoid adenosyltransferase n=1 Tax=Rhodovulum adriaticum TaxID=35804 RepID=A0A4R2NKZ3_RHOAD|nr:cob(I)yrinic acid a,c-diamide adenosyltransferase [Rhodovulum adriaticum]MBK1637095.1 ATP:cob(I)alamin adenosyltransferase [Rhodovulum adriaticum]TCP21854.1 ATP:cob(I)alamin adenosyltransferase [Rhodovulum adriaticum]